MTYKKVTTVGTYLCMEISLPLYDMKALDLEVPRTVPKPRRTKNQKHPILFSHQIKQHTIHTHIFIHTHRHIYTHS